MALYFACLPLNPGNLSVHLRTGVCLVHQHGYTAWSGIDDPRRPDTVHKSDDTRYGVLACTTEGDRRR